MRQGLGATAGGPPPSVAAMFGAVQHAGILVAERCDMPAGRPRIIESPQELLERASAYFDRCERNGDPVLLTGLILALGLSSRQSLAEYEARGEFTESVRWAKSFVECEYERRLALGQQAPSGPIFALKNFGWRDTAHQAINETRHVISWEPMIAEEWERQYGND